MAINSNELYARVVGKLGNPNSLTFNDLCMVLSEFQAVYAVTGSIVDATDPLNPALVTSHIPIWQKASVTATDLSAASHTKTLTLDVLAANEIIHAVVVVPRTVFSGGAIASYAITIGISGTVNKYLASSDLLATPSATLIYAKTPTTIQPEATSGTTTVSIYATSDVNTSVATSGTFDVYWLTSILP